MRCERLCRDNMLVCRLRAINLRAGSQINDTIPKATRRTPVGESSSRCETSTMRCLSCAPLSYQHRFLTKSSGYIPPAKLQFKLETDVAKPARIS